MTSMSNRAHAGTPGVRYERRLTATDEDGPANALTASSNGDRAGPHRANWTPDAEDGH